MFKVSLELSLPPSSPPNAPSAVNAPCVSFSLPAPLTTSAPISTSLLPPTSSAVSAAIPNPLPIDVAESTSSSAAYINTSASDNSSKINSGGNSSLAQPVDKSHNSVSSSSGSNISAASMLPHSASHTSTESLTASANPVGEIITENETVPDKGPSSEVAQVKSETASTPQQEASSALQETASIPQQETASSLQQEAASTPQQAPSLALLPPLPSSSVSNQEEADCLSASTVSVAPMEVDTLELLSSAEVSTIDMSSTNSGQPSLKPADNSPFNSDPVQPAIDTICIHPPDSIPNSLAPELINSDGAMPVTSDNNHIQAAPVPMDLMEVKSDISSSSPAADMPLASSISVEIGQ